MKCLYAPWRSEYTESTHTTKQSDPSAPECFFCNYIAHPTQDEKHLVLRRLEHTFVVFNKFPYNAGHLLVVPLQHLGDLEQLSPACRLELMEVTTATTIILRDKTRAQGFNVGVNMGMAAGASIPTHLHMHILPRWVGDTNFLPTLSDTKVISSNLRAMYHDLKPHFDTILT